MRKKLTVLATALATAAAVAAPAQAVLDEGGGGAPSPVASPRVGGFDWADAGIGAGIGVAAAAATGVAMRRRRLSVRGLARPAAH